MKTIFPTAPFNSYNYKEIMCSDTDRVAYEKHKDILRTFKKYGLPLDIKVHPNDIEAQYDYWRNMTKSLYPKARILRGFPVENIWWDYDLFIIEYTASNVCEALLSCCKRPFILYKTDTSNLREDVETYLSSWDIIARSAREFDKLVWRHKNKYKLLFGEMCMEDYEREDG